MFPTPQGEKYGRRGHKEEHVIRGARSSDHVAQTCCDVRTCATATLCAQKETETENNKRLGHQEMRQFQRPEEREQVAVREIEKIRRIDRDMKKMQGCEPAESSASQGSHQSYAPDERATE